MQALSSPVIALLPVDLVRLDFTRPVYGRGKLGELKRSETRMAIAARLWCGAKGGTYTRQISGLLCSIKSNSTRGSSGSTVAGA